MTKIELEIHDDIMKVISKIKNSNDSGFELVIPKGSVLFDNILDLKVIEKYTEEIGASVQFTSDDEIGNNLISSLEGESDAVYSSDSLEENSENFKSEETNILSDGIKTERKKLSIKFPRILPSGKKKIIRFILVPVIIAAIFLMIGFKTPKAEVKIVLSFQSLTRSTPIKVKAGTNDQSILKGKSIETTIQGKGEIETTGEKIVGEKAEGKVIIYNNDQEEDITLKKGAELKYENNDSELVFTLDDEVTIPMAKKENSSEPGSPIIPGKKEAEVTASAIGDLYNIESGETLEISKYKKSILEAESKEDFEGGKSEKKKIVSEEDIKNLSAQVLEQNKKNVDKTLNSRVVKPSKIVPGAVDIKIAAEVFSHKLGDETDKLSLDQTISVTGLSYSDTELNKLLDKLLEKLIPQGYVVSNKDRVVNVEVLGNSTNSVLNSKEADLQVTIKTSVVPNIDKDSIKKDIAGKTPQEAEKVLGSIQSIKTYSLVVKPGIPFFKKVPKDFSRINLTIENE